MERKEKKKEKQHSCASEGRHAVPLGLSATPSVRQGWGVFLAPPPFFFCLKGRERRCSLRHGNGCRGEVAMQGDNQEDKWKAHPGPGTKGRGDRKRRARGGGRPHDPGSQVREESRTDPMCQIGMLTSRGMRESLQYNSSREKIFHPPVSMLGPASCSLLPLVNVAESVGALAAGADGG